MTEEILNKARNLDGDWRKGAAFMLKQFEETGYGSGRFEAGLREERLTLHTGGWSECEELIAAAMESMWWILYWYITKRGGHYQFRLEKKI